MLSYIASYELSHNRDFCLLTLNEFLRYRAGPKIPKGHARVFWGLDSLYSGIAVVGLGKQGLAINKLEEIHEGKESVRAAAAGNSLFVYYIYKLCKRIIIYILLCIITVLFSQITYFEKRFFFFLNISILIKNI